MVKYGECMNEVFAWKCEVCMQGQEFSCVVFLIICDTTTAVGSEFPSVGHHIVRTSERVQRTLSSYYCNIYFI